MPYNKIFWRHERNRLKYIVTFVPSTRLQVWAPSRKTCIYILNCLLLLLLLLLFYPSSFFFLRLTYHLKW